MLLWLLQYNLHIHSVIFLFSYVEAAGVVTADNDFGE